MGSGIQDSERTAAAIEYLKQGRNAHAFLLLTEGGAEKDPASQFALGLCHFRAGDFSAAISCFEQARAMLKAIPAKPEAVENTATYQKLAIEQIAKKTYLVPMDLNFCKFFPKAAEQNVLMAMIDTFLEKGMNEQAKRLSSALIGPVFESYKKKLME